MLSEIQVRTLAQHIWAAGSHKLQYKREASVPPPLRRAIYRVSALLETVDLEFSRVLDEREAYLSEELSEVTRPQTLNVDLLRAVLDEILPPENKRGDEDYDGVLIDLTSFPINTDHDLRNLLSENMEVIKKRETELLTEYRAKEAISAETIRERLDKGVFLAPLVWFDRHSRLSTAKIR
jgi:hypothetical protein